MVKQPTRLALVFRRTAAAMALIAAIDQGTSNSKVLVFTLAGEIVAQHSTERCLAFRHRWGRIFGNVVLALESLTGSVGKRPILFKFLNQFVNLWRKFGRYAPERDILWQILKVIASAEFQS